MNSREHWENLIIKLITNSFCLFQEVNKFPLLQFLDKRNIDSKQCWKNFYANFFCLQMIIFNQRIVNEIQVMEMVLD